MRRGGPDGRRPLRTEPMRVYPIRHGESEANRLRVMAYRGHGHGGWFKVRLPQAEAA